MKLTSADVFRFASERGTISEWFADEELGFARFTAERMRIRVSPSGIAWAYEGRFDRWANSRDAITDLPRSEAQLADMLAYLAAHRDPRDHSDETFVAYRVAAQWAKNQPKTES